MEPQNQTGPIGETFNDSSLKAAIRKAFDYPNLSNIEAVAAAAISEPHGEISQDFAADVAEQCRPGIVHWWNSGSERCRCGAYSLSPTQAPLKELLKAKIVEAKTAEARAIAEDDADGMSYHDGRASAYEGALAMLEVSALSPHPPTSEPVAWIVSARGSIPYPHIERLVDVGQFPSGTKLYAEPPAGSPHPPTEERK